MLYKHTVVLRTRPVTHFAIRVFYLTHLSRFGGAEKEKLTNHMCKISQLAPDSVCLHLWYVKLCVRFSLTRMLLLTDCLKHSDSRVSTMSWTGKEGLMRLNISHNEVMLKKKECSSRIRPCDPLGHTYTRWSQSTLTTLCLALQRSNAWIMQTHEKVINSTFSVMLRVGNKGEEKCESGEHLFTAVLFTELCNFLNLPNDHTSCE